MHATAPQSPLRCGHVQPRCSVVRIQQHRSNLYSESKFVACRSAAEEPLHLRCPSTTAMPALFMHVPPVLAGGPLGALAHTLPPARFAALWTSLPHAAVSREWLLRLVDVITCSLWLSAEQCSKLVADVEAHHGWDHTKAAGIKVCSSLGWLSHDCHACCRNRPGI